MTNNQSSRRQKIITAVRTMPREVWQILATTFFFSMGMRLNWLFLNFHLEELGFSRDLIGYANAMPAVSMVLLGIPISLLAPRFGYVVTLRGSLLTAAAGFMLVGWGTTTAVIFTGLFATGLGMSLALAATPPLLQQLAPPEKRVQAFSWFGALGTGAGFLGNLVGGYLPPLVGGLPGVIYLMAVMFLIGLVPLWRLRGRREAEPKSFRMKNPHLWVKLILPNTIIAFGAGAVMPFLNLYLADKFGLSFEWIGFLFSISALATTITILIQPKLVEMWGKVGAVAASQAGALPFILVLAYVPFLPLVTVAMFVREALMNAANPIYTALGMQLLAEEESAAYMIAVSAMWRIAWAISSSLSGRLQEALGVAAFDYLFAAMFGLYCLSILLLMHFFWQDRRRIEAEALGRPV